MALKGFASIPGFSLNRDSEVRLTKTFKQLESIPLFAHRELRHLGSQAVGRAKANATKMGAVDSGRLRSNIKHEVIQYGVRLHSEAIDPVTGRDYASTVHNGLGIGRNAISRPYLGHAYNWMIDQFAKRVRILYKGVGT